MDFQSISLNGDEKSSFWDFRGAYDYVDQWPMMSTPLPLMIIIGAYLLFVLKVGPELMKNRKPFELSKVLVIYNAFQVVVATMIFKIALGITIQEGLFPKTCMRSSEIVNLLTTGTYYYVLCKVSELLDTIFFVLRKKQNQVSFLHVYHHTLMACGSWALLKYEPGYTGLFLGLLNCFVHMVMYTYYGLSGFKSLTKYLWWKKYITKLQLTQFVLILVHMLINLSISDCKTSKLLKSVFLINLPLFIYLFTNFYKKMYSKTNNDKKEEAREKFSSENKQIKNKGATSISNNMANGRNEHTGKICSNGNGKVKNLSIAKKTIYMNGKNKHE